MIGWCLGDLEELGYLCLSRKSWLSVKEYLTVGRGSRADRGRLKVLGTQSSGAQAVEDGGVGSHGER